MAVKRRDPVPLIEVTFALVSRVIRCDWQVVPRLNAEVKPTQLKSQLE
jgi:hypothetical protein